jgi:hypothetical protein
LVITQSVVELAEKSVEVGVDNLVDFHEVAKFIEAGLRRTWEATEG